MQSRKNCYHSIYYSCESLSIAIIGIFCALLLSQNAYSNSWTKCRFSFKGIDRTPLEEAGIDLKQLSKKVDETNQQYSNVIDQVNDLLHTELIVPYLDKQKHDQQLEENVTEHAENPKLLNETSKIIFIAHTKYNAKLNQLIHIAQLKMKLEETIYEHALFVSQKLQKQIDHLDQQMNSYKEYYMK